MVDIKDFSFFEEIKSVYDFKGFFNKNQLFRKWFLISLLITAVATTRLIFVKKNLWYGNPLIAVRKAILFFYTSNTSLVFNCRAVLLGSGSDYFNHTYNPFSQIW
jgi:hypothetical protein